MANEARFRVWMMMMMMMMMMIVEGMRGMGMGFFMGRRVMDLSI
jgi:hypothetical protein